MLFQDESNEISEKHIAKPSDVLTLGQKVKVKVLDIDKTNKRLSLTIKDDEEKSKDIYNTMIQKKVYH